LRCSGKSLDFMCFSLSAPRPTGLGDVFSSVDRLP